MINPEVVMVGIFLVVMEVLWYGINTTPEDKVLGGAVIIHTIIVTIGIGT